MECWKFLVCCGCLLFATFAVSQGQGLEDECPRHHDVGERKCTKRCDNDVDCKSRKKTCECDGVCGKSCVNENLRCAPVPRQIPNGKVTILPYNKFGAVARYTCNDGYTLVGLPARVCQGDETWNGEEPRCELNHRLIDRTHECKIPPLVHHAHHTGAEGQTNFELGSNLRYQCDPGYMPRKDSVDRAWCVGGGIWVGPNMTCISATPPTGCDPPPPPINGAVDMLNTGGLEPQVAYRCESGYFLVGNKQRTCTKDGTWDGREPSCEQVVCGPPPHVEHAEHDGEPDQYRYVTGTQLTYSCQFGYYREGSGRAICSGPNGYWVGPTMTCKGQTMMPARDCGAPGEINNGWRDPGYRFTYPTRVTYHCNEGYELQGRGYRECQANGEWSGILPECQPIHCLELRPPLHGTMIGSGTTYGSVIRFVCNDGYKVVGSAERTCQADRTWSGQDAFCEEINCGVPGPLWNGYLDGHRTTVGAVYFYRCNIRTKFHGDSFSTQCLENGQWSYPTPKCLGQCQVPSIMNGTIENGREGVWVDTGTVITPACLNGLVLNDSTRVVCGNGTWNIIPRCVPGKLFPLRSKGRGEPTAPCDLPPPLVESGHRVFFGVRHGDRARYFCIEGYKLNGDTQYLTCQYGSWERPAPVCVENYCNNPGELTNGTVYKKGFDGRFKFENFIFTIKHGTRLEYECDRDFELRGPRGAACVNGQWSPTDKPRCVQSRHPLFHKLWKPVEEQKAFTYRRRR